MKVIRPTEISKAAAGSSSRQAHEFTTGNVSY